MNIKRKYAICVDKNRILYFDQVDEKIIDVYEMQDISNATLFDSREEVLAIIKYLTEPSIGNWEYTKYYNIERIDIVDIDMMYCLSNKDEWKKEIK